MGMRQSPKPCIASALFLAKRLCSYVHHFVSARKVSNILQHSHVSNCPDLGQHSCGNLEITFQNREKRGIERERVFALFLLLCKHTCKVAPKERWCHLETMVVLVEILGAQWEVMQLNIFTGVKLYSLMIITSGRFCPSIFLSP